MRRFFLGLLVLWAACGQVNRQDIQSQELSQDPGAGDQHRVFAPADSLILTGDFISARDTLLSMLNESHEHEDEILFRLMGMYRARAQEDDFIGLLDSLELAGHGPYTGWKISTLDLEGRPEEALPYALGSDSCLVAWLEWETDSTTCSCGIPPDASPGEIYAVAASSGQGSLSRSDLERIATFALIFPSLEKVLIRELRSTADSSSDWRIDLLESVDRGSGMERLYLELLAEADSGSLQFWLDLLQGPDYALPVAASELVQRFSGMFRPKWAVTDRLLAMDLDTLAGEYSAGGDRWSVMGSTMALLLHEGRYGELSDLTGSLVPQAPDSLLARAALFRAHGLKGAGRPAADYYGAYLEFSEDFPWHPLAREMAYNVGKYFDCEQEWGPAADAYLVSLETAGQWEGDERAHWRGGFCLYMSGRTGQADSLWSLGCSRWPFGYWGEEMLYWRGRLAGENGDLPLRDSLFSRAASEHPWEFYGILAAVREGSEPSLDFRVPDIRIMSDPACSLAVSMTSAGYGAAAAEMLRSSESVSLDKKAEILSLMGFHGSALSALRVLDTEMRNEGEGVLPDSLLCLYFPQPYSDLAVSATDTLLLDANMLQGIMREESYFDRYVVSRAGARGVVQLMPTTASDVSRWYGLPRLTEEDYFDPARSVPYGALYIDRQVRDFAGQYPLFLAAYNAGPGNATRWVGMHGWNPDDPELYIEQITYRETRMYVKKVLRSAWIYERR